MVKADLENPPVVRARELDEKWRAMRVPTGLDRANILSLPEMRDALKARPRLRERIRTVPPSVITPPEGVRPTPPDDGAENVFVARSVPPDVSAKTYQRSRAFYEQVGKAAPKEDPNTVQASVILISGCQDNQTSADIGFNGLFTWMVKKVWNDGAFAEDHRDFHKQIKDRVTQRSPEQSPCLFPIGAETEPFIRQRPYAVE
jgi:hypothetical protein